MAEKTVILTIGGTTVVNCAANTERTLSKKVKADYDVAPHGFNGFCDAVQLFCIKDILGLGIGNVDQNYPLFGIPTLRFRENIR